MAVAGRSGKGRQGRQVHEVAAGRVWRGMVCAVGGRQQVAGGRR